MSLRLRAMLLVVIASGIMAEDSPPPSEHELPKEDIPTRPDYRGPGHWATPAPDSAADLGFVPMKLYAQVRHTNTFRHLPRSDALASASTPEEIANAPRLREVVSSKKLSEVYSEEGYEDSAYDHGGYDKNAEKHEGYERKEAAKSRRKPKDSQSESSDHRPYLVSVGGTRIMHKEELSVSMEDHPDGGPPVSMAAGYSHTIYHPLVPPLHYEPQLVVSDVLHTEASSPQEASESLKERLKGTEDNNKVSQPAPTRLQAVTTEETAVLPQDQPEQVSKPSRDYSSPATPDALRFTRLYPIETLTKQADVANESQRAMQPVTWHVRTDPSSPPKHDTDNAQSSLHEVNPEGGSWSLVTTSQDSGQYSQPQNRSSVQPSDNSNERERNEDTKVTNTAVIPPKLVVKKPLIGNDILSHMMLLQKLPQIFWRPASSASPAGSTPTTTTTTTTTGVRQVNPFIEKQETSYSVVERGRATAQTNVPISTFPIQGQQTAFQLQGFHVIPSGAQYIPGSYQTIPQIILVPIDRSTLPLLQQKNSPPMGNALLGLHGIPQQQIFPTPALPPVVVLRPTTQPPKPKPTPTSPRPVVIPASTATPHTRQANNELLTSGAAKHFTPQGFWSPQSFLDPAPKMWKADRSRVKFVSPGYGSINKNTTEAESESNSEVQNASEVREYDVEQTIATKNSSTTAANNSNNSLSIQSQSEMDSYKNDSAMENSSIKHIFSSDNRTAAREDMMPDRKDNSNEYDSKIKYHKQLTRHDRVKAISNYSNPEAENEDKSVPLQTKYIASLTVAQFSPASDGSVQGQRAVYRRRSNMRDLPWILADSLEEGEDAFHRGLLENDDIPQRVRLTRSVGEEEKHGGRKAPEKYLSSEKEDRRVEKEAQRIEDEKDKEIIRNTEEWKEALRLAEDGKKTVTSFDRVKFPFYHHLPLNTLSSFSPLRYAINPRQIPRKSEGGMEFYESRESVYCPEVSPNLDVVPKRRKPGEWNQRPRPKLPRLKGLGDKIDCLRTKYFGLDPLDNPLFQEASVGSTAIKHSGTFATSDDHEQSAFYADVSSHIQSLQSLGGIQSHPRSYPDHRQRINHNLKTKRPHDRQKNASSVKERQGKIAKLSRDTYPNDRLTDSTAHVRKGLSPDGREVQRDRLKNIAGMVPPPPYPGQLYTASNLYHHGPHRIVDDSMSTEDKTRDEVVAAGTNVSQVLVDIDGQPISDLTSSASQIIEESRHVTLHEEETVQVPEQERSQTGKEQSVGKETIERRRNRQITRTTSRKNEASAITRKNIGSNKENVRIIRKKDSKNDTETSSMKPNVKGVNTSLKDQKTPAPRISYRSGQKSKGTQWRIESIDRRRGEPRYSDDDTAVRDEKQRARKTSAATVEREGKNGKDMKVTHRFSDRYPTEGDGVPFDYRDKKDATTDLYYDYGESEGSPVLLNASEPRPFVEEVKKQETAKTINNRQVADKIKDSGSWLRPDQVNKLLGEFISGLASRHGNLHKGESTTSSPVMTAAAVPQYSPTVPTTPLPVTTSLSYSEVSEVSSTRSRIVPMKNVRVIPELVTSTSKTPQSSNKRRRPVNRTTDGPNTQGMRTSYRNTSENPNHTRTTSKENSRKTNRSKGLQGVLNDYTYRPTANRGRSAVRWKHSGESQTQDTPAEGGDDKNKEETQVEPSLDSVQVSRHQRVNRRGRVRPTTASATATVVQSTTRVPTSSSTTPSPRRIQAVEHRRVTKEEIFTRTYIPDDDFIEDMERESEIQSEEEPNKREAEDEDDIYQPFETLQYNPRYVTYQGNKVAQQEIRDGEGSPLEDEEEDRILEDIKSSRSKPEKDDENVNKNPMKTTRKDGIKGFYLERTIENLKPRTRGHLFKDEHNDNNNHNKGNYNGGMLTYYVDPLTGEGHWSGEEGDGARAEWTSVRSAATDRLAGTIKSRGGVKAQEARIEKTGDKSIGRKGGEKNRSAQSVQGSVSRELESALATQQPASDRGRSVHRKQAKYLSQLTRPESNKIKSYEQLTELLSRETSNGAEQKVVTRESNTEYNEEPSPVSVELKEGEQRRGSHYHELSGVIDDEVGKVLNMDASSDEMSNRRRTNAGDRSQRENVEDMQETKYDSEKSRFHSLMSDRRQALPDRSSHRATHFTDVQKSASSRNDDVKESSVEKKRRQKEYQDTGTRRDSLAEERQSSSEDTDMSMLVSILSSLPSAQKTALLRELVSGRSRAS